MCRKDREKKDQRYIGTRETISWRIWSSGGNSSFRLFDYRPDGARGAIVLLSVLAEAKQVWIECFEIAGTRCRSMCIECHFYYNTYLVGRYYTVAGAGRNCKCSMRLL